MVDTWESSQSITMTTGRARRVPPHASGNIQQIVYNRCASARRHWLAKDRRNAAFHFGVATHFYMDGLICSPSVNEFRHESGDREFAQAVTKAIAPYVTVPPEVRVDHIVGEIRKLSSSFGKNDLRIVANALGVLITLGHAVTAPAVPQSFSTNLERLAITFSQRLREFENDFTNQLAGDEAFNRLVDSSARQTAEHLLRMGFVLRCLVAAYLFDNRNGRHILPIVALFVRRYFRRRLMSEASQVLHKQLDVYCRNVDLEHQRCRETISSLNVDEGWYSRQVMTQLKSARLEAIGGTCNTYHEKFLIFKDSSGPRIQSRTRMIEGEFVAGAKERGSALWENTFSDWLGRESIEFRPLKYLWLAMPLSAPAMSALVAAFFSSPSWTVVAILFGVSLVFSLGIWNMVSTCQSIRRTFQEWIVVTCPKCHATSETWKAKNSQIVFCPVCRQKLRLCAPKSHRTGSTTRPGRKWDAALHE